MSEDDALEAALKASRFQMEQHAVLSQADRAMQAARLKEVPCPRIAMQLLRGHTLMRS